MISTNFLESGFQKQRVMFKHQFEEKNSACICCAFSCEAIHLHVTLTLFLLPQEQNLSQKVVNEVLLVRNELSKHLFVRLETLGDKHGQHCERELHFNDGLYTLALTL